MASSVNTTARVLQLYYAATVLFLVLDYFLGINVRLAALDHYPAGRAAYYLLCFLLLALLVWRPRWSTWVAAAESLLTLSMLIISMALRVMIVSDDMIESGRGAVTANEILNFVIAGAVAYFAWQRNARRAFDASR